MKKAKIEKTKIEKAKTMEELTKAWKRAGEMDPAKLDFSDILEVWKSEYSKEDCEDEGGIRLGCRKLSWRLIKKMGIARLSRMQMNAIVQLALHQDENGIVFTNNHIMCSALGCHESYFMDLLHSLEDAGLIRMERTRDWRHHKNGVWRVELIDNSFADGYEDDPYVRLGHSFFQSQRFLDMVPPAKYMAFRIFYEMRGFKKEELGEYADGHWPVLLGYASLLRDTADWAGYCRDTCLDAFRAVAHTWEVQIVKNRRDARGRRGREAEIEVYLTKEDAAIKDTDAYTYLNGMLMAVLEEEGVNMSAPMKAQKNPNALAGLILKFEKMMKGKLKDAGEKFKDALILRDATGNTWPPAPGAREAIRENEALFTEAVRGISTHAQRLYYDEAAMQFSGSSYKLTDSRVLRTEGSLPLWAKMIVPTIITSCKWLRSAAAEKALDLKKFDVAKILDACMETLVGGEKKEYGYLFGTLFRNRLKAQAA